MMIRGGNDKRLAPKRIQILNEAIDDALEFAEFLAVAPQLRDRVEFIQKEDTRILGREVKQGANVLGGAPQVRRNQPIKPRHEQLDSQFPSNMPSETAFACARWTIEQEAQGTGESLNIRLCVTFRDAQELVDDVPLVLSQHDGRFHQRLQTHPLDEWKATLGIDGQGLGQRRPHRSQLVVVLFQHLSQPLGGVRITGFFELIRQEGRVVPYLIDVETKRPVDDTNQLAHELILLRHETIMRYCETIVNTAETPENRKWRHTMAVTHFLSAPYDFAFRPPMHRTS